MNTKLKREEEDSSLEEDLNINTAAGSILIYSCSQLQIPTDNFTASASLELLSVKLTRAVYHITGNFGLKLVSHFTILKISLFHIILVTAMIRVSKPNYLLLTKASLGG